MSGKYEQRGAAGAVRVFRGRVRAAAPLIAAGLVLSAGGAGAQTQWSMYGGYTTSYSIPFISAPDYSQSKTSLEVSAVISAGGATSSGIKFEIDTGSTGVALPAYDLPGIATTAGTQTLSYSSSENVGHGTWVNATVTFNQGTPVNGQVPTATVPVFVLTSVTDSAGTSFDCTVKTTASENNCFKMMGVGYGRPGQGDDPGPTPANNPLLHIQGMDPQNGAAATVRAGYVITPTGIQAGLTAQNAGSGYAYIQLVPTVINGAQNWQTLPGQIAFNGTQDPQNTSVLLDTGINYLWSSLGSTATVTCSANPEQACAVANTLVQVYLGAPGNPSQIGYAYVEGDTANSALAPWYTRMNPEAGAVNTGIHPFAGFYYVYDAVGGFVGLKPVEGMAGSLTFSPSLATQGQLALPSSFSTNLPIFVSAATSLSVNDIATFTGDVSGPGGLAIQGPGAFLFTGNVALPAGIAVQAGQLVLSGPTTSNIAVGASGSLLNAGALTGTVANAGFYLNMATHTGALTNSGIAQNIGTIAGTVENTRTGTLANDGSINGKVTNHGTLIGNGTINGDLMSDGRLAPGHSLGHLHVAGNLTLPSTAVYAAELGANGASDLISVDGAVRSDGALLQLVTVDGYTPTLGANYTVLTAGGGILGGFVVDDAQFGAVASTYPFLAPSLATGAGGLNVTLVRSAVSFAAFATTANQRGAALGADSLPSGAPLLALLAPLSGAQVPAAFTALSGELYPSTMGVLESEASYLRNAVNGRLLQDASAVPAGSGPHAVAMPGVAGATLWGQAYAGWGGNDGDANAAGSSSSIGGFVMGLDTMAWDWRMGLAAGFSQSRYALDTGTSSGQSDNYDLAVYAGRSFGPVSVRLGAAYTWHDISSARSVLLPNLTQAYGAGYGGGTAQVFGEVGYSIPVLGLGAPVVLEPFAGLSHAALSTDSFSEGFGGAALTGVASHLDTTSTVLGLRAAMTLTARAAVPVILSGMLGWQHAFGDLTPQATLAYAAGGSPFTIYGAPLAADALVVSAGLSAKVSRNLSFAASYAGQLGSAVTENAVKGSLVWSF